MRFETDPIKYKFEIEGLWENLNFEDEDIEIVNLSQRIQKQFNENNSIKREQNDILHNFIVHDNELNNTFNNPRKAKNIKKKSERNKKAL